VQLWVAEEWKFNCVGKVTFGSDSCQRSSHTLNMLLIWALFLLISVDAVRGRPNFIIMLMDDVS